MVKASGLTSELLSGPCLLWRSCWVSVRSVDTVMTALPEEPIPEKPDEEKKNIIIQTNFLFGISHAWWCLHQWLQCKDDLLREPSAEELWHDTGSAEPERFRLQPTDTLPTTPGTKETSASDNDHLCTLKGRSVFLWERDSRIAEWCWDDRNPEPFHWWPQPSAARYEPTGDERHWADNEQEHAENFSIMLERSTNVWTNVWAKFLVFKNRLIWCMLLECFLKHSSWTLI